MAVIATHPRCGAYGDGGCCTTTTTCWTAWILPIAATIFAVSFTEFSPDHATAEFAQGAREPTGPPPSFARIFDWPSIPAGIGGHPVIVSAKA